ncbi:hypothetical protein [Aeromonas cavernicola]|uniref:Aminoglycoside phosphotransferase domain-containing protein n=1 Tax=Aeromonas cavernicola TaxID=1006623 RepID=A0A2H9U9W7_9GAMM|nr:hypothetical protein [Aeromonas cavernicola]PJG60769.1 hypothetical protein CUC53_00030 [Aeromonas cavernicola]
MNPKVNARQARLMNMLERQEEISVGRERDCPLPVTQLLELKESHPSVLKLYQHGRTAEVFHLKLNGRHWCLKRCRQEALLAHPDGKTAFLTELERRREIEALRELHPTLLANVVCTSFGSAQAGILVSPWLRGEPVHCLNERNLAQMLDVEAELARWGWFDWDPNPSNLLDDGEQISLFDFGYMWTFDPRFEYNSNGLLDPEFHVVERLETCTLSGLWLAEVAPLPQFRYWRELCLKWVQRETDHLTRAGASALVLDRLHQLQRQWTAALASDDELTRNWLHDMYRSHRLNVISTQEGTSSDPLVQDRLDWLLRVLTDHYPQLAPGLTAQEVALGQAGLLEQWQQHR